MDYILWNKKWSVGTNTNFSVPNICFFVMEALRWDLCQYSLQLVWLVFLPSFFGEFPNMRGTNRAWTKICPKISSFLNSGWKEQFKAGRRSWPNTTNNILHLSWWCWPHQQTDSCFHWCPILFNCVMLLNICLVSFILILFTSPAVFNILKSSC